MRRLPLLCLAVSAVIGSAPALVTCLYDVAPLAPLAPLDGGFDAQADAATSEAGLDARADAADAASSDAGDALIFSCANAGAVGLVGYWPFDEGDGGIAHDCTGNRSDGRLLGEAGIPTWTAGHDGGHALTFDNALQTYVSIGSPSALNITGAITVSAWINLPAVDAYYMMGRSGGWCLGTASLSATFSVVVSGSQEDVATNGIQTSQWIQITGVFRPDVEVAIYVNGTLSSRVSVDGGTEAVGGGLFIGDCSVGGVVNNSLTGTLDDVRIFDRALSPTEIAALASQ